MPNYPCPWLQVDKKPTRSICRETVQTGEAHSVSSLVHTCGVKTTAHLGFLPHTLRLLKGLQGIWPVSSLFSLLPELKGKRAKSVGIHPSHFS